jgi:hypothetical protein
MSHDHSSASLLDLATCGTALPVQLHEISNAGLPRPIASRRRVPPFGGARNSYAAPLFISARDRFKLFHF